jgi:uncharacterized protein YukE
MMAKGNEALSERWSGEAQRHDEAASKAEQAADRFEFQERFNDLAQKLREIANIHRHCAEMCRGYLRNEIERE